MKTTENPYEINITSFYHYIDKADTLIENYKRDLLLFRGQSENKPLLPAIARKKPKIDTESIEKEMLTEFERRSQVLTEKRFNNDWETIVYAQHFGLKTRLLDWTSNPLVALWFTCIDERFMNQNSYVYVLLTSKSLFLDTNKENNPFDLEETKVIKPTINNARLVAQSGWFTAHQYSTKDKQFVSLEKNEEYNGRFWKIVIPHQEKKEIIKKLNLFGVSYQTMYPDVTGLCKQINLEFQQRT